MLASDWSTRDHMSSVDQSEGPVSRLDSRPVSRRYFGDDWKQGQSTRILNRQKCINAHIIFNSPFLFSSCLALQKNCRTDNIYTVQGCQGVTTPFLELQTSNFAWKFIWTVPTHYEKKIVRGVRRGNFVIFELQTPDFAWKFIWTVPTNYEKKIRQGHQKGGG